MVLRAATVVGGPEGDLLVVVLRMLLVRRNPRYGGFERIAKDGGTGGDGRQWSCARWGKGVRNSEGLQLPLEFGGGINVEREGIYVALPASREAGTCTTGSATSTPPADSHGSHHHHPIYTLPIAMASEAPAPLDGQLQPTAAPPEAADSAPKPKRSWR
jgi:hypothetical protein